MKSLPDGLFSSGKLRFLDLHGNQLTDVPTAFQNAFTLIKLNLNANAIRTLHAASFIGLSGLLELKISMLDQLEQIEGNTFTPLRKLKKLDCSANPQLRSIHPNAFNNVTNLKEVFHVIQCCFRNNGAVVLNALTLLGAVRVQ